jgi:hypothetical protein
MQINSGEEVDKAASDFTSAYNLLTSKVTLLYLNNDIPCLEHLLKHEKRLGKLWQVMLNPACKTEVN